MVIEFNVLRLKWRKLECRWATCAAWEKLFKIQIFWYPKYFLSFYKEEQVFNISFCSLKTFWGLCFLLIFFKSCYFRFRLILFVAVVLIFATGLRLIYISITFLANIFFLKNRFDIDWHRLKIAVLVAQKFRMGYLSSDKHRSLHEAAKLNLCPRILALFLAALKSLEKMVAY